MANKRQQAWTELAHHKRHFDPRTYDLFLRVKKDISDLWEFVQTLVIEPASETPDVPAVDEDAKAYDIVFSLPNKPTANFTYPWETLVRAVGFEANFFGSQGTVGTNPTSSATFTVKNNGMTIGTIVVSTGGVVSFLTTGSPADSVSLAIGDRLTLTSPTSQDATMADVAFTLRGTKA